MTVDVKQCVAPEPVFYFAFRCFDCGQIVVREIATGQERHFDEREAGNLLVELTRLNVRNALVPMILDLLEAGSKH